MPCGGLTGAVHPRRYPAKFAMEWVWEIESQRGAFGRCATRFSAWAWAHPQRGKRSRRDSETSTNAGALFVAFLGECA